MSAHTPKRHLVRGILGGLLLGIGIAVLLWQLGITAVSSDLVVGLGLLVGIVLGAVRLPRTPAPGP
jgi:hypothetical protein